MALRARNLSEAFKKRAPGRLYVAAVFSPAHSQSLRFFGLLSLAVLSYLQLEFERVYRIGEAAITIRRTEPEKETTEKPFWSCGEKGKRRGKDFRSIYFEFGLRYSGLLSLRTSAWEAIVLAVARNL